MRNPLTIQPPVRMDDAGSGEFGSSRGSRTHKGIDYAAIPGSILLSPIIGVVNKYGRPYVSGRQYKYIEIKDNQGYEHRFFYTTDFLVEVGEFVGIGTPIAIVADITKRYPDQDMTAHVHYEVKLDGMYFNPDDF